MSDADLLAKVDSQFIGTVSPTAPRIQAGGHPCQGIYWTPKGKRPQGRADRHPLQRRLHRALHRAATSPRAAWAFSAGTRAIAAPRISSCSSMR